VLPEVLYDLAVIRLASDRREAALSALKRAIALNPKLLVQARGDSDLAALHEEIAAVP
jgi:hypothetical protein